MNQCEGRVRASPKRSDKCEWERKKIQHRPVDREFLFWITALITVSFLFGVATCVYILT